MRGMIMVGEAVEFARELGFDLTGNVSDCFGVRARGEGGILSVNRSLKNVGVDGSFIPFRAELGSSVIELCTDEIVDSSFHVFAMLWFESDIISLEGCS